jgi:hypothetical protein
MHPSPSAPTVHGLGVDPDALDETRRDAMVAQTAVPQDTAHSRSSGRLGRVLGTVCGLAIAAVGLGLIGAAAGGLVVPASVTTTTPPAAALHSRSSPLAHITSPVSALVTPPCVLHNRDWARVNLKPRRYVGCRVDIAGNMYTVQVMDGYVDYDTNLDPNGSHEWYVFARDYADNPPSIAANTYVEITGKIAAASEAYSSVSGGFTGYVPQIRVARIRPITARAAFKLGMAAT